MWSGADFGATICESASKLGRRFTDWEPTENGNVRVLNDHRAFLPDLRRDAANGISVWMRAKDDRTGPARRGRVPETIRCLPHRAELDARHAGTTVALLFRFLHQNGGTLCRRGRERQFATLTDDEASRIEAI